MKVAASAPPAPPPPVAVPNSPYASSASRAAPAEQFDNDDEDSSGVGSDDDEEEDEDDIIDPIEDARRLSRVQGDFFASQSSSARNSSVRSAAADDALAVLNGGGAPYGASSYGSHPAARAQQTSRHSVASSVGGRRGSSRRASIPELLSEIGLGLGDPSLRGSQREDEADGGGDERARPPLRSGRPSLAGGAKGHGGDDEGGEGGGALGRGRHRASVVLGRGSASMFDASIRKQAAPGSFGALTEGDEEDAHAQALLEQQQEEEEQARLSGGGDSDIPSTGLLVPLERLTDTKLNGGRGYTGMLEQGDALPLDELVCALTSPCWQGVAAVMAIDGFDQEVAGWAPPEYHVYVTAILCAYKAYLTPDRLLTHLTTLYVQLGNSNLPPSSAQARAYHTVRERVLYVLLLWARRHPDDFDSKTPSAATSRGPGGARMSVTQTSNSRRALLHQFTTDALEQAHDEGGRHGELARLLQALLAIIEQQMPYLFGGAPDAASVFRGGSAAPSGRGSFGGGRSRASSSPSQRNSGQWDSPGAFSDSSRISGRLSVSDADSPAPLTGGRLRAATTGGRRDTRNKSITQGAPGEREWGVDYWKRLLSAPSSSERGYVRELAEQLAVHESALLRTIRPSELQGLAFAKATKKERAPNVQMMIQHFNRLSRWVCTQVVKQPTARDRARCVRLFIDLAKECRDLGNMNGVMEIVAALNSAALHRLKKTWEALSKAGRRDFDELCALVKPERSHAALRAEMKAAARRGAAVPYLGLYLTDLTFIEDGNPHYVDADDGSGARLVNLGKCCMLGKVLSEVLTFQNASYDTPPNEALALYYTSIDPPEDDEIYALSLTCEPREGGGGGGGGGANGVDAGGLNVHGRVASSSVSSAGSSDGSPASLSRAASSLSAVTGAVSPRGLDLLRKGARVATVATTLARQKSSKAANVAANSAFAGWDYVGGSRKNFLNTNSM